ncbi:superoxide dismutase [FE] SODA [Mycobacterium tuberculosis]|nr:superoxide dismutase [FE] SODA [Mycobacterium tuberculosis]
MAEYTLPDLDWDYGALEPHISGQINELHHSKHHATYVKGANDAVAKLEEARAKEDHSAILLNEKNLAFNLAGHVNHTIWWKNLSPNGGDKPTGELAAAIAAAAAPCHTPAVRPDVTCPNDTAADPNSSASPSHAAAAASNGLDPAPEYISTELISGGNTGNSITHSPSQPDTNPHRHPPHDVSTPR